MQFHRSWDAHDLGWMTLARTALLFGTRSSPCAKWNKKLKPWWLIGKESTCQCRRHGFDPWSGKIPTCLRANKPMYHRYWTHALGRAGWFWPERDVTWFDFNWISLAAAFTTDCKRQEYSVHPTLNECPALESTPYFTYCEIRLSKSKLKKKRTTDSCVSFVAFQLLSCPTLLSPHGLQPARLLCPQDFPATIWSGVPFPSPRDLPNPRTEPTFPMSPELAGAFFTTAQPRKPHLAHSRYLVDACKPTSQKFSYAINWHVFGSWVGKGRGEKISCRFSWLIICSITSIQKQRVWTSLLVQWLRICLPVQGTQVQSLVGDLRPHMLWSK